MATASALGQKTGPIQTGGLYQHSTTSKKKNKNQVAHHENCETYVCVCIKYSVWQPQQKRHYLVILIWFWSNHYLFLILQCDISVMLYVWFMTIKFQSPWEAHRCTNYFHYRFCLTDRHIFHIHPEYQLFPSSLLFIPSYKTKDWGHCASCLSSIHP